MFLKILFYLVLFIAVLFSIGIIGGPIKFVLDTRKQQGGWKFNSDQRFGAIVGSVLCLAATFGIWYGMWAFYKKTYGKNDVRPQVEMCVEKEESAPVGK